MSLPAILLVLVASVAAAADDAIDLYDLEARLFTGADPWVGSFMWHNPSHRATIGLPLEPISRFDSHACAYVDFDDFLLEDLWKKPAKTALKDVWPVYAPQTLSPLPRSSSCGMVQSESNGLRHG